MSEALLGQLALAVLIVAGKLLDLRMYVRKDVFTERMNHVDYRIDEVQKAIEKK